MEASTWEEAAARHTGLVATVVKDLGMRGAEAEDAKQEGLIALRKIAARFDPSRNAAFSTFCRRVLVRHLIKYRKGTNMVRIPSSTLDKHQANLKKNPNRAPDSSAATMQWVERTLRMQRMPLGDLCHPEEDDDAAEHTDELEWLRKCVLKIPVRPRQALIGALGLFGAEREELADIAAQMGVPLTTVHDLLRSAVNDLVLIMSPEED